MIARSGKIVFTPGKFDAVLRELRKRIADEERAHATRTPFWIHPEVAERMAAVSREAVQS